jgi:hypothetical protein
MTRQASSTLLLKVVFSVKPLVVITKLNVTSRPTRLQSNCLPICQRTSPCCGDRAVSNIDMLPANYD